MFIFYIRESIRLFSRAKLSSFLTFVSTTIAVILMIISFFLFSSTGKLEEYLKENITISVFIKDISIRNNIDDMKEQILSKGFVNHIEYISKEEAVNIFINETGEDFRKILDYNPLPASFNLRLKSEFAETDSVKNIINILSTFPWVDEVVYRDDIIQKILVYLKEFRTYVLAFTLLIIVISLYLVYSTVRLILNSRTEEFETMKLVGAKLSTIKVPIILNGFIIGIISSVCAGALYYLILTFSGEYISALKVVKFEEYPYWVLILSSGPTISILSTIFSLRKVSLKIKT